MPARRTMRAQLDTRTVTETPPSVDERIPDPLDSPDDDEVVVASVDEVLYEALVDPYDNRRAVDVRVVWLDCTVVELGLPEKDDDGSCVAAEAEIDVDGVPGAPLSVDEGAPDALLDPEDNEEFVAVGSDWIDEDDDCNELEPEVLNKDDGINVADKTGTDVEGVPETALSVEMRASEPLVNPNDSNNAVAVGDSETDGDEVRDAIVGLSIPKLPSDIFGVGIDIGLRDELNVPPSVENEAPDALADSATNEDNVGKKPLDKDKIDDLMPDPMARPNEDEDAIGNSVVAGADIPEVEYAAAELLEDKNVLALRGEILEAPIVIARMPGLVIGRIMLDRLLVGKRLVVELLIIWRLIVGGLVTGRLVTKTMVAEMLPLMDGRPELETGGDPRANVAIEDVPEGKIVNELDCSMDDDCELEEFALLVGVERNEINDGVATTTAELDRSAVVFKDTEETGYIDELEGVPL
ncbi:uncharacterized protein BDZ99DRAFT_552779 [Mytilinidion resinicola]|uniref:Uncharacterized protein n=1 Tax=Mytilinidion resinicola TaxID=574789 RepID=A0A6A6XZN5_9PEZI|nr:uncharacterized protein BDZ99DRAFT_552779 [Mytilinidion resinicola]KAF2801723.1 hypothetical protein BDZ99DRAFT_552779 [Mytilinidion resinicola]